MKILVAPDKFKGCLSASDVADCIAAGIRLGMPRAIVDSCPIADGGEGTVSTMLAASGGRLITRRVTGPLPEMKVDASFAMLADGKTAVIEMSAASGLSLVPSIDRDPLNTTTFGTGELINAAVREGARRIILGLGGSATIDAGIGCAQACGFTVLLKDGEPTCMTEPLCGRDVDRVLMVKQGRGEITAGIEIIAACDVAHPLSGPDGAAVVFGPQKGANASAIAYLDAAMLNLVVRMGKLDDAHQPGAGAAGGMGFAVTAFFNGSLRPGFDIVAETINLRERLKDADLCITGEGRLDEQTLGGKAVAGIARLCREINIPCVALVGSVHDSLERIENEGLVAQFSICDGPMTIQQSMTEAPRLLKNAGKNLARLLNSQCPSGPTQS
jgi:glycerate kinase